MCTQLLQTVELRPSQDPRLAPGTYSPGRAYRLYAYATGMAGEGPASAPTTFNAPLRSAHRLPAQAACQLAAWRLRTVPHTAYIPHRTHPSSPCAVHTMLAALPCMHLLVCVRCSLPSPPTIIWAKADPQSVVVALRPPVATGGAVINGYRILGVPQPAGSDPNITMGNKDSRGIFVTNQVRQCSCWVPAGGWVALGGGRAPHKQAWRLVVSTPAALRCR